MRALAEARRAPRGQARITVSWGSCRGSAGQAKPSRLGLAWAWLSAGVPADFYPCAIRARFWTVAFSGSKKQVGCSWPAMADVARSLLSTPLACATAHRSHASLRRLATVTSSWHAGGTVVVHGEIRRGPASAVQHGLLVLHTHQPRARATRGCFIPSRFRRSPVSCSAARSRTNAATRSSRRRSTCKGRAAPCSICPTRAAPPCHGMSNETAQPLDARPLQPHEVSSFCMHTGQGGAGAQGHLHPVQAGGG